MKIYGVCAPAALIVSGYKPVGIGLGWVEFKYIPDHALSSWLSLVVNVRDYVLARRRLININSGKSQLSLAAFHKMAV